MDIIEEEKRLYFRDKKDLLRNHLMKTDTYFIWKFLYFLRKEEIFLKKNGVMSKVLLLWYRRKKNSLGRELGFDIPGGVLSKGVRIFHKGLIVMNPSARIGEHAVIVGNLCIGNVNGENKAAQIGEHCMFGWGCSVIGEITIADNCRIGAGALVNKNVTEQNAVMVGIPAKNIKKD